MKPVNAQDICLFADLGCMPYDKALALQKMAHAARVKHGLPDMLLLLEHPPTITRGRSSKDAHLLASPQDLALLGIDLYDIDRGGDVTFHGPGQLVGYPVIDLNYCKHDIHQYLRDLEETIIRALDQVGVPGHRVLGLTGVFVGDGKIAAIGVRARRWVSMHGFAVNVTTDLSFFSHIVPCGIHDRPVTSLAEQITPCPSREQFGSIVAEAFGHVFSKQMIGDDDLLAHITEGEVRLSKGRQTDGHRGHQ